MLGFATIAHDTDAVSRCDDNLRGAVAENGRVVYVHRGTIGCDQAGVVLHDMPACLGDDNTWEHASYLGKTGDTRYLSIEVDPARHPDLSFVSLRDLSPMDDQVAEGLCVVATALAAWHETHRHCVSCGGTLRRGSAGWDMSCIECGQVHFPRHDPSVIMAIRDPEDRLLLGHAATWQPGRYSCLAGFVEAGETLEHAVCREALEEASIVIDRVEYVASQPWPFPRSLMTAFRAWTSQSHADIRVDGVEVTEAKFFTRAEFIELVEAGELTIPSRCSAGRALIEDWYGEELNPPAEQ